MQNIQEAGDTLRSELFDTFARAVEGPKPVEEIAHHATLDVCGWKLRVNIPTGFDPDDFNHVNALADAVAHEITERRRFEILRAHKVQ